MEPDSVTSSDAAVVRLVLSGIRRDGILPATRVPETQTVDVTDEPLPAVAAAVAVIRGARIIRVAALDVAAVRRVCAVLGAVMDAR